MTEGWRQSGAGLEKSSGRGEVRRAAKLRSTLSGEGHRGPFLYFLDMDRKVKQPKTSQEAIWRFDNPDNALTYMVKLRWPNGVVACPSCGRTDVVFLKNQRKWQCKTVHPKRQFSAKVGTIFENSRIPLEKWLVAVWMICNCKNGVSSYELAKAIGISQKSAWFMLHRIRLAMSEAPFNIHVGKT